MKEAVDLGGASVRVGRGDDAYTVVVGAGLLEVLPSLLPAHVEAHRYAIVSDDRVARLHAEKLCERCREAGLDTTLLTFPAGEASKSRKSWSILTDEMLEAGLGRDSCVVAVGGGVTTDLAGFVAATYMRGVPVVQVPTSYLAMIDAAVGGKTGVDVKAGKNLVGAFHSPTLVVVDPKVLVTLPFEERAQGLVEAFKHGAILDLDYFDELEANVDMLLDAEPDAAQRAVLRSVELKAGVVTEDEREEGYRQILNFGHTVGHAVEAASDYRLGHGSAVAVGMAVEARAGEAVGVTEPGTALRLESALAELLEPEPMMFRVALVGDFLGADKKSRLGRIRCVLLGGLGVVDPGEGWTHGVPEAILIEALEGYLAAR